MIKKILITVLFIVYAGSFSSVYAADEPFEFASAEQEQRFKDLIEELRCLVCQNQSLADSNADLAQDLRQEVYDKLKEGDNNEDIITYLVERYGDFVLYRPPFKASTFFLWLSPVIFLFIGALVMISLLRKQESQELNEEQKKYADQLLSEEDNENKI